jgi:hypothetical protein
MKNVKEMMKFILKAQIPLIPLVIIMLIYTRLYNLELQADSLAIVLVYFGMIVTGLFGCLSFVHGRLKIRQSLKTKENYGQFFGVVSGLLSIVLSGFILFGNINTILTTKARAVETFPSLFVTEKETYPIEKIKLKNHSETSCNDFEIFYTDKNGKVKSITISHSEVDIDIYNVNNTKQNIQITKKFIPKTVAEKYEVRNYKFYKTTSYKIVENVYQKGK